jgi:hypothetical protein
MWIKIEKMVVLWALTQIYYKATLINLLGLFIKTSYLIRVLSRVIIFFKKILDMQAALMCFLTKKNQNDKL